MGWNVDQIYNFAKFLIFKEQAGTYSPSDFFYAFNSEQRSFQSDLLGRFQARSNGKSGLNTGMIENETIQTALSPFTIPISLPIVGGMALKPSNYVYGLAMRIGDYRAIPISKSRIYSVKNSVIDPPSLIDNKYYFTEYADGFQFLPSSVTSANFDYICDCTDVVWAFTLDVNELAVYDSGNSIQPLWNTPELVEITKRTMKSLGVHFSSQDFENFGQNAINTGN